MRFVLTGSGFLPNLKIDCPAAQTPNRYFTTRIEIRINSIALFESREWQEFFLGFLHLIEIILHHLSNYHHNT
jgi:hypothetical protein